MKELKADYSLPERNKLPERFVDVFSLPKFQQALAIAAKHTAETGLESFFQVLRVDSTYWIEKVRAGGTDSTEGGTDIEDIDGYADYNLGVSSFLGLHFHPDFVDEPIVPSFEDLRHFKFKSEQIDFEVVGHVNDDGRMKLLVLQKPTFRLVTEDIEYYIKQVDGVRSQEEVQAVLGAIGIETFVLEV